MRRAVILGVSVLVAGVLSACEDEGGTLFGPSAVGLSISLTPSADTIFAADTTAPTDTTLLVATVRSAASPGPLTTIAVTWTSSEPQVASVAAGVVTAHGFGTTTITAEVNGKSATAKVTVVHRTTRVSVTPANGIISVDDPIAARDSLRLTAVATDRFGAVVKGTRLVWRSSAPTVATVDSSGLLRALALGTTTITATGGGVSGNATLVVRPLVKSVTIAPSTIQVLAGDTLQLSAAAVDQANQALAGRKFVWTSSAPAIATIDSTGRAIFVGRGSVSFTATTGFVTGTTAAATVLSRVLTTLEVGTDFACGVANLGRGYCWGIGDVAQLGIAADSSCRGNTNLFDLGLAGAGAETHACTITPKRFAPVVALKSVSAGLQSACGIGLDSFVYCWGSPDLGRRGDGLKGTPVSDAVVRATVSNVRFKSVSVGGAHACAISTSDAVYCWGSDAEGQLGDQRLINSTTPIPLVPTAPPRWTRVSAGGAHTCGITDTGAAYCWGSNQLGQLGIGTTAQRSDVPLAISSALTFREIASGGAFSCAIAVSGAVYCWGQGDRGQLGDGLSVTSGSPVLVAGVTSAVEITAGEMHACARLASGSVMCWGWNDWGQVGTGGGGGNAPSAAAISGITFVSVSAGARHTCGIATDETAYCWGSNVFGAFGNELQAAFRASPQPVAKLR